MTRREALYSVSLMFGGTIVGAQLFLEGCSSPAEKAVAGFFTADEVRLLDEVGDTIIPDSADSPGAKAAKIGEFMQTIVADCYPADEQDSFRKGIADLQARSQTDYQKGFLELSPEDRKTLLTAIDAEAQAYDETLAEKNTARLVDERLRPLPPHYLTMMKQLTLWGYFTSEVGATKALRYLEVPGRYDGCAPYEPGEKAWALG